MNKIQPPELEHLPEWVEEATAVLEEFFKVREYILSKAEELPEEELRKMYSELLLKGDDILREWKERKARRILLEAEFVGVRRLKAGMEVLMPEVRNVGELKEMLRRYGEELERKGYPISARIVGVLLEDIEGVPEDVAAVPREALDRAPAHVLTAARVYRVLRDEGWHGKLLGAAKRTAMGDRQVLEKLKERLRNMFPASEEVYPEHPEEVERAMDKIADTVTSPEVITSLTVKPYPYDYMEFMERRDILYLRVAKEIELARRTHEIIPVKEVAKTMSLLEPKAWKSIVEKQQP